MIRVAHPWSGSRCSLPIRIPAPNPGSATMNKQQPEINKGFSALGNMMSGFFIPGPDPDFFYPSRILSESRIRTGSRFRIRNTSTITWVLCSQRRRRRWAGGWGSRATRASTTARWTTSSTTRSPPSTSAKRSGAFLGEHWAVPAREYFSSSWIDYISASVSDPDPNWFRFKSGQWIRIWGIRIRIQEGRNDPQKKKNFHVLKCQMSFFWGLKASKASSVTWTSFIEA